MLLIVESIVASALSDSSTWCPLAIPPFRIRAIRRAQGVWTGDVYLAQWTPGANITLTWSSPMRLIRANHANLSSVGSHSASFVLQASGPADGSGRVMCAASCLVPAALARNPTRAITCARAFCLLRGTGCT
jgi:hypothetical protein